VHGYHIDTDERRYTIYALVALGIGAAFALNRFLDLSDISIPWWLDAPASFGFFGLFYWLFDQWAWSFRIWRTLRLAAIPVLCGRWLGYIASSHDPEAHHEVAVNIRQTWTTVSVVLTGANSRSHSTAAVLRVRAPAGPEFTHTYLNEPLPNAVGTMNIHHGTATLRLAEDGQSLDGEYYTGRGRQTYGSIHLKRIV
jgi:hypothetical protein